MPTTTRTPLVVAGLIAAVAIGWRLVDAADWPGDRYPSLEYESALAARTVWLAADARARTPERELWLRTTGTQYVTSPPFLPALVASVYAATGEECPWVSRVFMAGFWVAGGALVGAAGARLTGSRWAGVAAFAWLVLCPFGMMVSRSFQTESLLVFALGGVAWHLARAAPDGTWRRTGRNAVVCGLAALVKPGVLFPPILGAFAAALLSPSVTGGPVRKLLHFAAVAVAVVAPGTVYAWLLLRHHSGRFMPRLLGEGWYYEGVAQNAWDVVGPVLGVGLVGVVMAARAGVLLPAGLLLGHAVTLAVFTYHAATHDYYQVPLLVITALAGAWPVAWVDRLLQRRGWDRFVPGVALAAVVGYLIVTRDPDIGPWRWLPAERERLARETAVRRARAVQAEAVRAAVGAGTPVIELTEGYGYPLRFHGWVDAVSWPTAGSQFYMEQAAGGTWKFSAEAYLAELTRTDRPYFVVAHADQWEKQTPLRAVLARYGPPNEPVPGVLIFTLRRPAP
ncbi:MAG TPA: glycosyltransferase family 39 protein [Urbifossiella sp.]|nr:glycosyltransferase family 39 protein [Urbifossiella sp.]